MPLLNRTPARVCIFRMFKAAREGFGLRTLGDMGTGKVKTGVRTSARFCISIFFDQGLIGIQRRPPRGLKEDREGLELGVQA